MFFHKSGREKKCEDLILHLNAVIRELQAENSRLRANLSRANADLSRANADLSRANAEKEELAAQAGNFSRREIAWGNLLNFDGTRQVDAGGDGNG